ncbi:MAG: phosphoribosylformylglycinamidine cyclo-ligase, partial [Candidatus Cloacimonetes bacterium]|nr:phosphoribosylformylglycinamidine cyclo-ligase [Candidatus Cloacimonadota bacterium]
MSKMTYADSGVDIRAGENAVQRIKAKVRSTFTPDVLTDIGSFGGLFRFDTSRWSEPVLVSSADGVGTKLLVARMAGRFDTVGQDLVNHCVNDIFAQGAHPLFFLDYIGVGRLDPDVIDQIIEGLAIACRQNDMALIGGEMAEMPDVYRPDDFDLVGTIVGVCEKERLVTGATVVPGDVVVGFPSTGLHTNGYTLARRIVFDHAGLSVDTYIDDLGATIGEALLAVHRSYYPLLKSWTTPVRLHAMAHITGGGIPGNL